MAQKYDIAIISGYFDPIHKGHLEYIEKSKKFAQKLIVILNNNFQTKLKKKKFFLDEKERKEILQSNKNVDEVFISLDKDKSVCKTIEKIASKNKNKKIVFANGGDRKNYEIPESKICKKLNIHIKDRIGKKIQSSSSLIKKAKYLEIGKRPWGKYFVLEEGKILR